MKSIQQTTPALRFKDEQGKDFPDWEEIRLGDLSKVKRGASPRPINLPIWFDEVSSIGWVRISDVTSSSKYLKKTTQYLSETGVKKSKFIPKGNIIMSICGTMGKPIYTGFDVCIHDGFVVFEELEANLEFFFYYLEKVQNYWCRYGQPGTQLNLNTNIVSNKKIKVPINSEQQKIASFLSSADTKIEQLGKKKTLLKQYKKGIMQKLFSQEIRFKDEQGNDYLDWERKKLGDLYEFKSTNSFSREKLNYIEGWVRNIHYGDIHTKYKARFTLNEETVPFVNSNVDVSNIREDLFCQEGDLVIADASEDYSEIGKTIELIALNNQRVLAGLHTLLARRISSDISTGYGSYMMSCSRVKLQIKRIAQGTKVLGISASRMKEIELPLPSEIEQLKIANFLSAIDKKIELVAEQLEQARTFKKGLLQKMFI